MLCHNEGCQSRFDGGLRMNSMSAEDVAIMLRHYHETRVQPIEEAVTELVQELRSILTYLEGQK